jgi:hypothetical protein
MKIDTLARAIGLDRGYLDTVPDTTVMPSPIHGRGLFTTVALVEGAVLVRLDGQRVSIDEAPGAMDAFEWNAVSRTELLVRPIRTSYGFVNHSRDPNVRIEPDTMEMITRAPIPAGTELTIDYLDQPLPDSYFDLPRTGYLRA